MPTKDATKELAIEWLKRDEGLRLYPYHCTAEKLSIGYGRNLDSMGITESEAEHLLTNDFQIARKDARTFIGEEVYEQLTDSQRAVLISMAFNMGLPTLKKFVKFKAALINGDIDEAVQQMMASKWQVQVGARAKRLAEALRQ